MHACGTVRYYSQVDLNGLLVECLAAARRWGDALAAVEAACKALPGKTASQRGLQRPLLGWKAACLSQLGRSINSEMNRVKEHPPEAQVRALLLCERVVRRGCARRA